MTDDLLQQLVGKGFFGAAGLAISKVCYDIWKSRGPVNDGHEAQSGLIKNLQEERDTKAKEADDWRARYEALHTVYTELHTQNALLKMRIKQFGATDEELRELGI